MVLRNPNLEIYGILYSTNIYEIKDRFIRPINGTVNVEITLVCYTDETKNYLFNSSSFLLKDLPNKSEELNPDLYQEELIKQHGEYYLDGTQLKDFVVLQNN